MSNSPSAGWPSDKFIFGVKLNSPSDINALSPHFSIVKISGYFEPAAIELIRQRSPNALIVIDVFDPLISEGYVDVASPQLRERLHSQIRQFYSQGIRHFELWHSPNLPQYGLGQREGWADGAGFADWYKGLVLQFKTEFSEISIGYPILAMGSEGGYDWVKFLEQSERLEAITDWVGINLTLPIPETQISQIAGVYNGQVRLASKFLLIEVELASYTASSFSEDTFEQLYQQLANEFLSSSLIVNVNPDLIPRLAELAAKLNSGDSNRQSPPTKGGEEQNQEATKAEQKVAEIIQEIVIGNSVSNDQLPIVDQLHYDDYARALAEVLVSEETTTPLTVGIYGAWGMGKSFLMRRVKQMVTDWPRDVLGIRPNAKKPKHEFHFVEFNAWVYSGSENLWAGLVTALYDSIENYLGRRRALLFRLGRNFRKSFLKTVSLLAVYGVLAILIGVVLDFDVWLAQWETLRIAATGLAASAIGVSALAALPPLINAIRDLSSNVALKRSEQLAALSSRRDFKDKIGFMADIKAEITEIRELLEDRPKDKPLRVVIMIDDLDRCPPARAVEVLEAIMLLLADKDGAPFIVLLGIDARIIVKAIEERYNKVLTEAGITGYEYLDKIVQIPFRIPEPDEANRKGYVASLLKSESPLKAQSPQLPKSTPATTTEPAPQTPGSLSTPTPQPGGSSPSDVGPGLGSPQPAPALPTPQVPTSTQIQKTIEVSATKGEIMAFEDFAKYLSPNPRRIKRIVNVYRVARLLPRSLTEDQRRKLIKWVILSEQWPLRLSWILEEIENDQQQFPESTPVKQENANADQPPTGRRYNDECTLGEVFEKIQERFDKTGRVSTLDGDPELFEQFIKQEPLISVADHKWLWPLSFNLNPAIKQEIWKARTGK